MGTVHLFELISFYTRRTIFSFFSAALDFFCFFLIKQKERKKYRNAALKKGGGVNQITCNIPGILIMSFITTRQLTLTIRYLVNFQLIRYQVTCANESFQILNYI